MLATRSNRVRRTATVHEDWSAWLPEAKNCLFDSSHQEMEESYLILSATLDDAIALSKQGMLAPARGQAMMFADLFDRLGGCLRGVLRALYEHGRDFGTLPNVAPLHAVFFRSERAQHIARTNSLISFLILRAHTRFFRKLGALEQVVADLKKEAHRVAREMDDGLYPDTIKQWRRLEILHHDLNTCLCETKIMLKSFFCVLPGDEVQEFRTRLLYLVPAIAVRSRPVESLRRTAVAGQPSAARRGLAVAADFSSDSPFAHRPCRSRDNSGSGDRISSSRMRPDGTGGPNETN